MKKVKALKVKSYAGASVYPLPEQMIHSRRDKKTRSGHHDDGRP
jgi:hypothetical protein